MFYRDIFPASQFYVYFDVGTRPAFRVNSLHTSAVKSHFRHIALIAQREAVTISQLYDYEYT